MVSPPNKYRSYIDSEKMEGEGDVQFLRYSLSNPHSSTKSSPRGVDRIRGEGGTRQKDKVLEEYDAKLTRVRWAALITTALNSINWCLGLCACAWATVVVLRKFSSQLSKTDFYCVSALLLLEAIRVGTVKFFGNIVTRSLVYRSIHPRTLRYDDSDRQKIFVVAGVIYQAFQLMFIAIGVILPVRRLQYLGCEQEWDHGATQQNSFDELWHPLSVFYFFALVNAFITVVAVTHSKIAPFLYITSYSLRRYYGALVERGMSKGLLRTNDFDFVTFAFKALSDECRRNIRPRVVRVLYKDLIAYLYAHQKGFQAACIALDSANSYEQEAAANIVGLWAELDENRRVLRLQTRLLTKLAEAVDNQETGCAATSSFEHLARIDPDGVLHVRSESGEKLVDIMISSIDKAVAAGKYDWSLVFVKALIPLLENRTHLEAIIPEQLDLLAKDLRVVFKSDSKYCLKRSKAVAGHALHLLRPKEPTDEEVKSCLRDPGLERPEHILDVENHYLLGLLRVEKLPEEWSRSPNKLEVRKLQPDEVPSTRINTAGFIAPLFIVIPISCAWVYVLGYSPF